MQTKIIFDFLENIRKNNNREWFNSHKDEYLSAKAVFEKMYRRGNSKDYRVRPFGKTSYNKGCNLPFLSRHTFFAG